MSSPMVAVARRGFDWNTRRKILPMTAQTKTAGSTAPLRFELPKVGLAARLFLGIQCTIGGTVTNVLKLGAGAVISRMRVTINGSNDIFNASGEGYSHVFLGYHDQPFNPSPQNQGRSAVSAATFNLDTIIPFMVNQRDAVGLIVTGNNETVVQLQIDFRSDASIVSAGTVAVTVTPYLEVFMPPRDPADYPNLRILHQILEDQSIVPLTTAGQVTYPWPHGTYYLQMLHGLNLLDTGNTPADALQNVGNAVALRVNNTDYYQVSNTDFLDILNPYIRSLARNKGVIPFDLASTSGLGLYDKYRDGIDSANTTALDTVLQVSSIAASPQNTLYSIRRLLTPLVQNPVRQ